jgi:hypothetical protein
VAEGQEERVRTVEAQIDGLLHEKEEIETWAAVGSSLAARIREQAEAVLAYDRASADRLPDGPARRSALPDVVYGDP